MQWHPNPIERRVHASLKWSTFPDAEIPLWVADMDLPCCEQVVRALERRASRPSYGYTFQPEELWRRVAGWLEQEHCWSVSRDSFVFSPSVVTSFSLLLNVFTSEVRDVR